MPAWRCRPRRPSRDASHRCASAASSMPTPTWRCRCRCAWPARWARCAVLAVDASAHERPRAAARRGYREADLRKRALTRPDADAADLVLHPDLGYWAGLPALVPPAADSASSGALASAIQRLRPAPPHAATAHLLGTLPELLQRLARVGQCLARRPGKWHQLAFQARWLGVAPPAQHRRVCASARSGCGPAINRRADWRQRRPGPDQSAPGPGPATGPAVSAAAWARWVSMAARACPLRSARAALARGRIQVQFDIELAGEQTLHGQARDHAARHQRRPPRLRRCRRQRPQQLAQQAPGRTGPSPAPTRRPGPSGRQPEGRDLADAHAAKHDGRADLQPEHRAVETHRAPTRWRRTSACCR